MDNFLSAEDEERLLALRAMANFRSAKRNDPAVTEILETSVYSVIYHFDVEVGVWEKQKQEGPLFLVKRSKHPEYGLFMLNRQTVKNVLLPLIPGETRVTITDANNLTLARRGEKFRKGVWFSEGLYAVNGFAAAILRVCGEPSKRPEQPGPSKGALSIAAPLVHGPLTIEDTFTSLFADVIKAHPFTAVHAAEPHFPMIPPPTAQSMLPPVPPIPPLSRYPLLPPQQPAPAPPPPHVLPHSLYAYSSHSPTPPPVVQQSLHLPSQPAFAPPPPPTSQFEHFSPYSHSPSPIPPPAVQDPVHPPGQTVDDLLMSLLGVTVSPPPQLPAHQKQFTNGQPSSPALPKPASLPVPVADPLPAQPLPPLRSRSAKVGESTFAQTAAKLRLSASSNTTNGTNSPSYKLQQQAIVDAVLKQDQRDGLSPGRADSKSAFAQDILRLIHTEPRFVDDLWLGYLARKVGTTYG